VVAGCVTDHADQRLILAAFQRVLERIPGALLVLAPRHPEKKDRMAALEALVQAFGLRGVFRTRIVDGPLDPGVQCLVLDTMGELRDFYSVASVAYVGRDHNILEPLSFDKPVTLSPGWEPRYPSYPVYRLLLEAGAVHELADEASLAAEWIRLLSNPSTHAAQSRKLRDTLERLKGASARNLELVLGVVGRGPLDFKKGVRSASVAGSVVE
jgi:3-deoxy-D-manno-octulosonic-acid transferase